MPCLQLSKEIGLILHGVGAGAEPCAALAVKLGSGIVASGNDVIVVSHTLIEHAELDEAVAHHVGVRC